MSYVFERPRVSAFDSFAGGVASMGDIMAAAHQQMVYVDNSFSADAAMERAYDQRNDEVFAATGIRPGNPYRDRPSLAELRRSTRQPDFRTGAPAAQQWRERQIAEWDRQVAEAAGRIPDQEVMNRLTRSIEGDAARIARQSDDRLARLMESRPGFSKYLSLLAGGATGSLRDPIAVMSLMLGGGPGAGRTIAGRILSTAAREALVNGATEAAMQPLVQAWREKAGLDHGAAEALQNIGFAALFGATFGAAGQAFGEAGRLIERVEQAAPAAEATLPSIRDALPAAARGALDQEEVLGHLDAVRPGSASAEHHDVQTAIAHRIADGEDAAFAADEAQIKRVARDIMPPTPAARTEKPPASLIEFLAARGGLTDHQGELASLDARRLIRDGGEPLDMAREAAEEAGYIGRAGEYQVTSVADLLDAIEEELRGRKIYARGAEFRSREPDFEAERARVESAVAEVARHAGPAVPDRILREAAEDMLRNGTDAFDAAERAIIRAEQLGDDAPRADRPRGRPDREARGASRRAMARRGDPGNIPGWSDAELRDASDARGPEPVADPRSPFDDPAKADADMAITPAEIEEFGALTLPLPDGRVVSLEIFMKDIEADEELAAIVKACRT